MLSKLPQGSHLETGYCRRVEKRRRLNVTSMVLYASLVGLIIGIGMLMQQISVVRDATAQRIYVTHQVRELQELLVLLQSAETGQRGYLLTNKARYRAPYDEAIREIQPRLSSLQASSSNDALISSRLKQLEILSHTKLSELDQTLRAFDSGNRAAATALVQTDAGQQTMESIRELIASTNNLLRARRDNLDQRLLNHTTAVNVLTILTLVTLLSCIGIYTLQIRGLAAAGREYESKLAAQSSVLNAIVDEIPAMVAVFDKELRYRLVNKSFEKWRRSSRLKIFGKSLQEVISDEEYHTSRPYFDRVLRGETVSYVKQLSGEAIEYVSVTYSPLFSEGGEIAGVIAIAHDVTQEYYERNQLKELSERDALTQLSNRAALESHLTREVAAGRGTQLGLIYIDLDHFKPINDRFGHAAGDIVLSEFANRLKNLVRPTDMVARLGGDEFVVALAAMKSYDDAQRIAEKIVQIARQPIDITSNVVTISASVGVALDADKAGGWQDLLARADALTYESKAHGRNRSSIQTPG